MRKLVMKGMGVLAMVATPVAAFAEEAAQAAASGGSLLAPALAIAAGFAIAVAACGGGIGQGLAAAAALAGIARNPDAAAKIQTPMIIALALIESLVIYALVISFLLLGKIG